MSFRSIKNKVFKCIVVIMFLVFKCILNYNKSCCHLLLFVLVGIISQQFLVVSCYMLFNCKIWHDYVKGDYKVSLGKKNIKELMCYFLIC
jgi:hypothetical protein